MRETGILRFEGMMCHEAAGLLCRTIPSTFVRVLNLMQRHNGNALPWSLGRVEEVDKAPKGDRQLGVRKIRLLYLYI